MLALRPLSAAFARQGDGCPQASVEDDDDVNPTIFREAGYRFYFFSREEARMDVHVHHETGEAKIWIEPDVIVAENHGLSERRLARSSPSLKRVWC